jgi:hypothetical protein
VPGLEPTDGFAINATTPNLEPLAPLLDTIRPIGPIIHGTQKLFNISESKPMLPGHNLSNKTSLTVLVPNAEVRRARSGAGRGWQGSSAGCAGGEGEGGRAPGGQPSPRLWCAAGIQPCPAPLSPPPLGPPRAPQAMLKLPFQLKASGALDEHERSLLTQLPLVSAATESLRMSRITQQARRRLGGLVASGAQRAGAVRQRGLQSGPARRHGADPSPHGPPPPTPPPLLPQVSQNMLLTRMVPYQYLTNATKLTTKLGFPVNVLVRWARRGAGPGFGRARPAPLIHARRPPRPPPAPPPSPDGKTKYLQSGNYTARIVVPDYGGRPLVPAVAYMVDSFLLPLQFKGV